jgi:hypothetical protein
MPGEENIDRIDNLDIADLEDALLNGTELIRTDPAVGGIWNTITAYSSTSFTGTPIYKDKFFDVVDNKVVLRDNEKVVSVDKAVLVNGVGYFLKNDPRLKIDYITNEIIVVSEYYRRYYDKYSVIFTAINPDGKLDINSVQYTTDNYTARNSLPILEATEDYMVVIDNDKKAIPVYFYISKELLSSSVFNYFYKESLRTGTFYYKERIHRNDLNKHKKYAYLKRKLDGANNFKMYMQNKPVIYKAMQGKKYTYGIEIETSSGLIPHRYNNELFFNAVHDGSLRDEEGNIYGAEYVTDVLYGDLGLLQLRKLTNELSKRCEINHRCGVHVHIGDINFTKENIILMYHLYKNLENSLFQMLPKSRRDNEYCRSLDKLPFDIKNLLGSEREFWIEFYYNDIIQLLSQGYDCNKEINKKHDHPKGFKCNYDHSSHRYCWVNFIPAVFNTRKNGIYTIEFRSHSATTSYTKIKNWLFICIGLIDVVENHKAELYKNFNLGLAEIMQIVYPKTGAKLNEYILKRTLKFADTELVKDPEADDYVDNEIDNNLSLKNL